MSLLLQAYMHLNAELNTRGRKSQAADVSDGATPTVRSRALKMSTFANVQ